ncbi:hypothetical protein GQ568_01735 [Patescibacteria group bacterium]|nr:hypothetical protein [Patescibacteria group bacterium]
MMENNMIPRGIESDNVSSREDFEQDKNKLDFVEKIVEKNYEKINEIAETIKEKIGIDMDFESIDKDTLRKVLIITDEISIGVLKIGSLIDKRVMAISVLLIPLAEKEIEIAKRELEGEEIDFAEKIKEKTKAILPENEEEDYENIDKAGELLDNFGNTLKGKKAIIVKIFAKLLKNREFQKGVSEKFREWLKKNEKDGKDIEESVEDIIKEELAG